MRHQKNITKEERAEIANRAVSDFRNRHPDQRILTIRLLGDFSWPHEFVKLYLFERDWLLWPSTKWDKPALVIACQGDGKEEAKFAMRFLSAFAWAHGARIEDEGFWIVGTTPNYCLRDTPLPDAPFSSRHGLLIDEHDFLPFPDEPKAQLALALYREGLCTENQAYKFLSFFKILNVKFPNGSKQAEWIHHNLDMLDARVAENLQQLRQVQSDVGQYLYVSGRCAVSHAWNDPIVNPDNPDDKQRLSADLPIIKALAELMIEKEFGVKRPMTVYREHLSELSGFVELLGEAVIRQITGEDFSDAQVLKPLVEARLIPLSVRLRAEEEMPFEGLLPKFLGCENGLVILRCYSPDNLSVVNLGLDFKRGRLNVYPADGFTALDDGSTKAALQMAQCARFIANLIGNGHLDVWGGDRLLGRKEAYLAENIDLGRTLENYARTAKRCDEEAVLRTIGNRPVAHSVFKGELMRSSALVSSLSVSD